MSLNILPASQKTTVTQQEWLRRIRSICIFVIACFASIDIVVYAGGTILNATINEITGGTAETKIEVAEAEELQGKIDELQTMIDFAKQSPRNEISAVQVHADVLDIVVDGIHLDSEHIDLTQKTVQVKGMADNRESIASLQTALEESKVLSNIVFPVGDLSVRENINFEFTANVHYEEAENTEE